MRVMRAVRAVGTWVDHRLQVGAAIHAAATHPVPRRTASWAYVFGSASLVLLTLQVVTGICLALVYVPSASEAYASLLVLNFEQPLGWFLRAMHGWGSNFMVAIVLLHMAQVLLHGAYKYPRELTWLAGVGLLLMTLGMAFTGQILRWDQDAYWGLGIGASMMGRVPLVGLQLVQILLGGPIIAGETLTRFFALHVFVIPGVLIAPGRRPPADGDQPRRQRVADAGAGRQARHLPEGVSRARSEGRPAVRAGGVPEGRRLRGADLAGRDLLLRLVRAVRADRRARSDDHRDGAAARLFLPLALRGAGTDAAAHGNLRAARRPRDRDRLAAGAAVLRRRRREELAPAPGGRVHDPDRRRVPGGLHQPGEHRAVFTGDGGVERRAGPGSVPQGTDRADAAGRGGVPGQAVPQLPRARTRRRRARARRSTRSRCG